MILRGNGGNERTWLGKKGELGMMSIKDSCKKFLFKKVKFPPPVEPSPTVQNVNPLVQPRPIYQETS